MDRVAAMLILLVLLVSLIFLLLALFAYAPIFCSCLASLLYTLYLFMSHEEHGIHHAQERENQFWTIFALLFSTAMFFAEDSPIAFGKQNPSLGFFSVLLATYAMHTYDRMVTRRDLSRQVSSIRRTGTATSSLLRLKDLGIPVEDQLAAINGCLADIDRLLIPSTLNNFINQRFVMTKEREIITIFEECDARALNYLVGHVKLGLLFYKIKDHRSFASRHRTELIQLLAVDRLAILTVMSRVIVLHALQLMKLRANPRAEYWVRNVFLNTHQDDLSELKTLTDTKGDYFCMNKLIHDDISSETTRQDILTHFRKEATLQQHHFQMGTKRKRPLQSWRKVLSDVDDTLCSSGGSYPAGVDKRYAKKVVYPGVLAFYRELDLGTQGPDEWPENRVGNLVFLSARPHVYKDVSEKMNFAKFEKLRVKADGRQGLHTTPSLLAGDISSGTEYMMRNDMEPLAIKKFDNFRRYVAIYPEYNHVFVCDNGQGDVRAGELMFDAFPYEFEGLFVHIVKDIHKTHGYAPKRWQEKGLKPCFFRTYPEAALDAATRNPPLIRISGLRRVCLEAVQDFLEIQASKWKSMSQKADRRQELNQSLWEVNRYLEFIGEGRIPLIEAEQVWIIGEKVRTPYGIAKIVDFFPITDLYEVELDWRPLSQQMEEHLSEEKQKKPQRRVEANVTALETVVESEEQEDDSSHLTRMKSEDDELLALSSMLTPPDKRPEKAASVPVLSPGRKSPPRKAHSTSSIASPTATYESSDINAPAEESGPKNTSGLFKATIQGRLISKYSAPVLPKVKKDSPGPLFSFWVPKSDDNRKILFKPGAQCKTPYGLGLVEEHREKDRIVVVRMQGWGARAYLNENCVEIPSKSLLQSLFSGSSGTPKAAKPLDFPYIDGTIIQTPFGSGKVVKPLAQSATNPGKEASIQTIGISLTNWKLANEKSPIIYCTVATAQNWREKGKGGKPDGLLSVFGNVGNLVSKTFRDNFLPQEKEKVAAVPPRFEQYYRDGAAVSTAFGPGVVKLFREEDGFYEISLIRWKLAHGKFAKAILRKNEISHRVAEGCIEGYPVLTKLGLTGTLASVDPTTGVHIVTIPSAGMLCYLQPDHVVRPLKAAVNEEVLTAYGDGVVTRYQIDKNTYEITLHGWNATLYAKAETFERAGDNIQQRDTIFGMLFNMLFSSDNTSQQGGNRSRSNSITSIAISTSGRSVSGRSVSGRNSVK